jgi:hypothetical protein
MASIATRASVNTGPTWISARIPSTTDSDPAERHRAAGRLDGLVRDPADAGVAIGGDPREIRLRR